MFNIDSGTIAMLIPIIAVLGGMTIAVVGTIMKSKQEELKHKERILAMEKGIALPEMPREDKRPAYLTLRAWGLILLFVGLGITAANTISRGFENGIWGLIPTSVGIGFLIAAMLEKKDAVK
jgi:hypothetical protein